MTDFLTSIGYGQWILHALLVLPLVGVLPILFAPEAAAKKIALAVTTLVFVLSAGLWWAYDPAVPGMQLTSLAPWLPQWGINYSVGIDGISLVMVLLTTLLMPLSVLGSFRYITRRERGFYALLLALETGMLGVFVALDLFVFYVFFEVMLIPMYFIIGIWGGTNRLYAAIKFFVYTFAGSILMLVALLVMVFRIADATGTLSFAYDHLLSHANLVGPVAPWLFLAFAVAFAIKVPVFPFHTWLPDAHVEAPTAGSVLLAGVMLKIGTYGFLRFAVPFFPDVAMGPAMSKVIVALAVIGIIYGALVAMVQPDFKKLVAYSSVSHLGFVMLGLWAGTVQGVQGALVVMISHGFSTGALFLIIGMMYERRHSRLIEAYGGIARVVPVLSLLLTFTALASIGLPGLSGFVGEFLSLLGAFEAHPVATIIATTGVIFAAAYMLWALQRIIFNRLDNPENEGLPDLSARELTVLLPLVAGMLWLGLYPAPVLRRMEPAAKAYVDLLQPRAASPAATTAGTVPVTPAAWETRR
ncbi:MAG TPA: NADH-quinone oxidoreductase subunit M [Gemmatimonadales bacterium]|nr:NADH-quinone oxidoreductase subunit M [Gemmatimonadales bacterium]